MKLSVISTICLLTIGLGKISAQQLKIMSYNIHHGVDSYDKDQLQQMAEMIKTENLDIVGLQEVDSVCTRSGGINQAKVLAELSGMHYSFTRHFAFEGGAYGAAILSKFPISNVVNNRLPIVSEAKDASVSFLTAEITVSRNKKLAVGVAHLDYRSQESRVIQARIIESLFKGSKLPVILFGDLNCEPNSTEIEVLRQYFNQTQPDTLLTFPTLKPVKKIDYILTSKKDPIKVLRALVVPVTYSDHLPIISKIKL